MEKNDQDLVIPSQVSPSAPGRRFHSPPEGVGSQVPDPLREKPLTYQDLEKQNPGYATERFEVDIYDAKVDRNGNLVLEPVVLGQSTTQAGLDRFIENKLFSHVEQFRKFIKGSAWAPNIRELKSRILS